MDFIFAQYAVYLHLQPLQIKGPELPWHRLWLPLVPFLSQHLGQELAHTSLIVHHHYLGPGYFLVGTLVM